MCADKAQQDTDEVRCPALYDTAWASSRCLLETGHDKGHLSTTGWGQRIRWWPCDDESPEQFGGAEA